MRVRIWLPGTRLSLCYDPFAFTALPKRGRCGGSLLLDSRQNGRTQFHVDSPPAALRPRERAKSARDWLAGLCGSGEVTYEGRDGKITITNYRGANADGARWTAEEEGGAWAITAIGPPGSAEILAQALEQQTASLTWGEPAPGHGAECPAELRGTLCSGGDRGHSAVMDLLIGPAPKDLHLSVIAIKPDPGRPALTRVLQGRQLLTFSRTLYRRATNWGSAAVPADGYAIVQLPLIGLGSAPPTADGSVGVYGTLSDGAAMNCHLPLEALRRGIVLQRPVPPDWRAINGPDELSIHRLAVAVVKGQILAAQRGAVDLRHGEDGPARPAPKMTPEDELAANPSFGHPVRAPCAGRVIVVHSDRDDQFVGDRDDIHPRGNQVCVERDDGLVVVLAHLRKGSIRVAEGERVHGGQVVAQVGNSGRSSEPHLHVHVADSAEQIADGVVFRWAE